MPVRMLITAGATADCTQAGQLIEGIDAMYLLADKGYDTDAIINDCKEERDIAPVIPSKSNRKEPRMHDQYS